MVKISFQAAHEQVNSIDLLHDVIYMDQKGIERCWTSDHYMPWWDTGGSGGAAWPWMGAALARTSKIKIGTGVTAPILRYHPAVVAQVFATLGFMFPDRVFLGIGRGEALNEVTSGQFWPSNQEKYRRIKEAIFDAEAGEIVCSNCGVVIQDNIESIEKEWRAYTAEALRGKERSGMPTSLAIHDRGLSTYISDLHMDAAGAVISPEQMSKIRRLQKWNKISNFNSRAYTRNLKNAFALLSRIKDKLSLTDAVTEKAEYYDRKALTKKLIKGS